MLKIIETYISRIRFSSSFTDAASFQLYHCGIDAIRWIGAVEGAEDPWQDLFQKHKITDISSDQKIQVLQPLVLSQTILVAVLCACSSLIALVCTGELQYSSCSFISTEGIISSTYLPQHQCKGGSYLWWYKFIVVFWHLASGVQLKSLPDS